jgi:cytochrome c oxidase cbb3-type subunit 4
MDMLTDLRVISTVLSFLVFLGICIWAFHRRSKAKFDEAAHIPFLDEDLLTTAKKVGHEEHLL